MAPTCLAALVAVVVLLRHHRPRRHRALDVGLAVAVVTQPALHLLGEASHGAAAGHDLGSGAAHLGLLGLHVTLAAVFVVGLVLAGVLVPAAVGAVERIAALATGRRGAPPWERAARVAPTAPAVERVWPWVAYAVRRGPPRTPSFA